MKVYTWPKVRMIARPAIDVEAMEDFLKGETGLPLKQAWVMEDAESATHGDALPEFCGRMCYVSFGERQGKKTNKDYIGNIVAQGHGSVLEHSNWSFLVTQASRGFTHEMVRHRAGFAFSQESTHYIDYTEEKNWSICLDPKMAKLEQALVDNAVAAAEDAFRAYGRIYTYLKGQGVKKKDACSMARQVLPTGIEAKLAFTANARALRHFVEYRGHEGNVLEIRAVAIEVLKIMKLEAPHIFQDLSLQEAEDGYMKVVSEHRKV